MTFYERYAKLCESRGLKPMSEQAANLIEVTRATISVWKKNGLAPKPETVVSIADAFGVSTDYLLGRTEDETDYSNPDLLAEISKPVLEQLDGDTRKAIAFQKTIAEDVKRERATQRGIEMFERLDASDKEKTEIFMQALLTHEKYSEDRKKRA